MRKIFVCIGFLFWGFILMAQNNKDKDSMNELISAWKNSLKVKIDTYGENHEKVLNDYFSLYDALMERDPYFRNTNHEEVLKVAQKCVDICLEIFGEKHASTAKSYHNLASLYERIRGDYNPGKALEYHQKALKINLEVLGEKHLKTAESYVMIGLLYSNMEINYHKKDSIRLLMKKIKGDGGTIAYMVVYDNNKSLEYFQKALEIKFEMLGEKHKDIAFLYDKIGTIHHRKKDNLDAIKYLQKALEISLKVLSEKHLDVAALYHKIGSICAVENHNSKALDYFQLAIEIRLEELGEKHYKTLRSCNSLADICIRTGENENIIKYYSNVLLSSYYDNRMAYFCTKAGDYNKALLYRNNAFLIALKKMRWRENNHYQQ